MGRQATFRQTGSLLYSAHFDRLSPFPHFLLSKWIPCIDKVSICYRIFIIFFFNFILESGWDFRGLGVFGTPVAAGLAPVSLAELLLP